MGERVATLIVDRPRWQMLSDIGLCRVGLRSSTKSAILPTQRQQHDAAVRSRSSRGRGSVAALWLLLDWDVWEERRHRAEPDQLGWLGGPASPADL